MKVCGGGCCGLCRYICRGGSGVDSVILRELVGIIVIIV